MKIVSYNVNGIRSAIDKGLVDWIEANDFDVICMQEVKAYPASVPLRLFESIGYTSAWHPARRKGYSGVATFYRNRPKRIFKGLGREPYDNEGRVLRCDFEGMTIINCYFPNGNSGNERQAYKMQFLRDFQQWVDHLLAELPNLIVVGDYNIAHADIDIANPQHDQGISGCLPEEREWLDEWFGSGFVDAFRYRYPETASYTWWRTTRNARSANQGWRLDYQAVSDNLAERIVDVRHEKAISFSDHCPVVLEIAPT
jgi:exodeoxyribonuclease-3